MRQLEDLPIWARLLLGLAAILLAVVFILLASYAGQTEVYPLPAPSPFDQHLVDLDIRSLDDAYQEQIRHLFHTWLRDDTGQPIRLINGARKARTAYIAARTVIEKRQ